MLVKSESLILRKTPFSENSAVIGVFTRQHGLLSFLVPGFQGKSGKAALLQPGNILELVYYYQENKNLKRIKDMKLADGFLGYNLGPVQLQTMLFCLELLQKSLPEEQEDPATFQFATQSLKTLSETSDLTWFPLTFLLSFIKINGLALNLAAATNGKIHMLQTENQYQTKTHAALEYLEADEILAIQQIESHTIPTIDKASRRLLIEKLLGYLRFHLFPEKELRSFPILMEVLD